MTLSLPISATDITKIEIFDLPNDALVINSESGQCAFIDFDAARRLKELKNGSATIAQKDSGILQRLYLADIFAVTGRELYIPQNILIEPVDFCDLSCPVCYRKENFNDGRIDTEWFQEILAFLRLYPDAYLTVSGGECTLHPDIEKIIEALSNLPNRIQLVTNGAIFSDKLIELCSSGKIKLTVSIDNTSSSLNSLSRDQKAFERSMDLLQTAALNSIPVKVNIVITRYNYENISELLEFLAKTCVRSVEFLLYFSKDSNTISPPPGAFKRIMAGLVPVQLQFPNIIIENVYAFYRRLSARPHNHCGAGRQVINILPNRRVKACPLLAEEEQVPLGQSLKDYFYAPGPSFVRMRQCSVMNLNECSECNLRYLCGGGCPARKTVPKDDNLCLQEFYWSVIYQHQLLAQIFNK